MHKEQPERWKHGHNYLPASLRQSERNTRWVIGLTVRLCLTGYRSAADPPEAMYRHQRLPGGGEIGDESSAVEGIRHR